VSIRQQGLSNRAVTSSRSTHNQCDVVCRLESLIPANLIGQYAATRQQGWLPAAAG
jgi:hypothetical protein